MQRMRIPAISASILLAVSWLLATWPPIDRFGAASSTVELEDISAGFNLLIAGALPWLLQWAAIAVVIYALCRTKLGFKRSHAWAVISFPLVTASIWWIGLATILWSSNPLEAVLEMIAIRVVAYLGGGSFWEFCVFDFAGPVTFPLVARGVMSLDGWNFLISGASTALVMLFMAFYAARCRRFEHEPLARQVRLVLPSALLSTLLYTLPAAIRCGIRVAASWQ